MRARQVEQAYLRVLTRRPSCEEVRLAEEFLGRQEQLLRAERRTVTNSDHATGEAQAADPFATAALVDLCLSLFNTSEFVYVD